MRERVIANPVSRRLRLPHRRRRPRRAQLAANDEERRLQAAPVEFFKHTLGDAWSGAVVEGEGNSGHGGFSPSWVLSAAC